MSDLHIHISLILSSLISGLLIIFFKLKIFTTQKFLLSFSGAFLLAISVLHLIPELYEDFNKNVGIFILLGFVLQLFLEFFSKGIEHGHFHFNENKSTSFPYSIFISLCLHAFVEGMALTENTGHIHSNSNNSLLLGIVIHKIPITIVLTTMLLAKGISKSTSIFSLLIFSFAASSGLIFGNLISHNYLNNVNLLLALAVGIFLHISTTILFETSEGHKFDLKKFGTILLGLFIALLTL